VQQEVFEEHAWGLLLHMYYASKLPAHCAVAAFILSGGVNVCVVVHNDQ
jgi:hypothetical protein